uniref:Uncharacterized protein n=2 Tax=Aegilops tauschii subsp. strangulata TaxID=200361 RepID=A0A453HF93_AEGTS
RYARVATLKKTSVVGEGINPSQCSLRGHKLLLWFLKRHHSLQSSNMGTCSGCARYSWISFAEFGGKNLCIRLREIEYFVTLCCFKIQ